MAPDGGHVPRMPFDLDVQLGPQRLAPPAVYQPVMALMLYMQGMSVQLLKHPVLDGDAGYSLGAASALLPEDTDTLLTALAGQGMTFMHEHTLACGIGSVSWWVPPGKRALLFDAKYTATKSIAALNGRLMPLPGLVMHATLENLRIFAVKGQARPALDTPLFQAPFWNMFDTGAMCQGSVRYPTQLRPQDQASWEGAFFDSVFTGPSRTDRYIDWSRSYQELLERAIEKDVFPESVLMPTRKTLAQTLSPDGTAPM